MYLVDSLQKWGFMQQEGAGWRSKGKNDRKGKEGTGVAMEGKGRGKGERKER
jgi:hypothetical protein